MKQYYRVKVERTKKESQLDWSHLAQELSIKPHYSRKTVGTSDGKARKILKQVLDNLKDTKGYWELKEEALGRSLWRTRYGRGCGPVVRQTTDYDDDHEDDEDVGIAS